MDPILQLFATRPVVFLHLVSAFAALLLGIAILARRKGTGSHRVLGWAWVLLMAAAAVTSALLRDDRLPNLWGFTPIHAFTVLVGIGLPWAVWNARRGNIAVHRKTMRHLYIGGCVVAGLFTLVPGRLLGNLLWKHALGVLA